MRINQIKVINLGEAVVRGVIIAAIHDAVAAINSEPSVGFAIFDQNLLMPSLCWIEHVCYIISEIFADLTYFL
jgi:hypothetical protein